MTQVEWIVQVNLSKQFASEVQKACKRLDIPCHPVTVTPFSDPVDYPVKDLGIIYGATGWVTRLQANVIWGPCTFTHGENAYAQMLASYGKHTLNAESRMWTLDSIDMLDYPDDKKLFVRPESDYKQFAGDVFTFKDLKDWRNRLKYENLNEMGQLPIVVAEPVGIAHEWRIFLVAGEAVDGSHYRTYHRLKEDSKVPNDVYAFAEARAKEYTPAPVFVMDIGESGGDYYVIEIGCFNSAGFYAADVEHIIDRVSHFTLEHYAS